MKHRITYIRDSTTPIENQVEVTSDSLHIRNISAAKEHRLTLGLSELSAELLSLIEQSKELHIRWTSPNVTCGGGPHASRLSPGLHVFYTPESSTKKPVEQARHNIISILASIFDPTLKDASDDYEAAFTSPPVASTRFARSTSNQLYSYLDSLKHFQSYIKNTVCKNGPQYCLNSADSVLRASSLDIDYDYISGAVILTSYWDRTAIGRPWDEVISGKELKSESIEVGIFNEEEADSHEEIKLGGYLVVVQEDAKPKSTLFSFPTRHYALPKSSFRTSFEQPVGLHSTLRIALDIRSSSDVVASNPTCALHTYLTLPSPLFLDKYAFTDKLFLEAHGLRGLRSISGATDLEAPDWAVNQWGSASLFELQPPKDNRTETVEITIPLHSRYMSPTSGGYSNVTIPYPVVFYACKAMDEDSPPLSTNPFDRTNLGYDGLFGERTIFYHVSPRLHAESTDNKLKLDVTIPVLDLDKASYIAPMTVLVIMLGSLWICWKLFGPFQGVPTQPLVASDEKQTIDNSKGKAQ